MRYVGINGNNNISVVSSKSFSDDKVKVVEVPESLANLSDGQLISECIYINGELKHRNAKRKISDMRIAFVGNWAMACGIANYNQQLWPHIAKECKDYKLFIEKNNNPIDDIYDFGGKKISKDKVIECWSREDDNLTELVLEIKKHNIDLIYFGHEFGIFPTKSLMAAITQLSNYKIIATMHSIFPNHLDKIILEACLPNIVTHLETAKKNLKEEKKIPGNVFVIEHGCNLPLKTPKLYNHYKDNHIFVSHGFGFPYKNFEASLYATKILKEKYKDIFFTLLLSESSFNKEGHQIYFDHLIKLTKELEIEENVGIVRGFLSKEVLNSFFKINNAAVYPYLINSDTDRTFGVSGAARTTLEYEIPVISSNIDHFEGLPTIKCNTPEEIANALDKIFSDKEFGKEQIAKQNTYLENNSWEKVSKKYIEVFESL